MSPLNKRLRRSIELLKPPPKQTVSEWAVTNRILSSEASAEPGKYNLGRAPFQKGWQDAISDPSCEEIFRNDMIAQVASGIDQVAINGGGSQEPSGILQTTGIGSVNMGDNGLAQTYTSVVNNIREVAVDNALDGSLYFLTNPKVVAKLRTVAKVSSTDSIMIMGDGDSLLGYKV